MLLTQPFIMHRWHERNQVALTGYYNDLLLRRGRGRADALPSATAAEIRRQHG